MTQSDLLSVPPCDVSAASPLAGDSLCAKLARYFIAREGEWVNARELLPIAGFAAWRSRLAELRFAPYSMRIENRTRRVNGITESHYRYVRE
mgnify:CR=1 FL=1